MASRSLSPYLQPGEVRGRSPYPKHLTGSMLGASDQARFCQPSGIGQVLPAVSATDTGERFSSHGNQAPAYAIPIDDPTLAKQEPRQREHVRPDADGQALPAMDAPSAAEDTFTRVCARFKARRGTKKRKLLILTWLLPFVFMCTSLHEAFRNHASTEYQDRFMKYGTTATLADWNVLRRASFRSRTQRFLLQSHRPRHSAAASQKKNH